MGSVPIVLTFVLSIALGFPLLMYLMQDRLLFHPQPLGAPQLAQIKQRFPAVREVFLESQNQKLHAWHVPGSPGAPLILYFGGNAEDVSWMIAQAGSRVPGAGWLLVNYRGYGGSGGEPSEAAIAADALRWYDHAVKALGARNVVAFGRSLGSGAAVYLASQRPISAVVLVSPFDSMVEVARHHYPFLPVGLMLRHRFESVQHAPRIQAPLLCLVAERDTIIPVVHSKRLFDAWAGPKRWVMLAAAGHNGTDDAPLFWPAVRTFLEGKDGPPRPP